MSVRLIRAAWAVLLGLPLIGGCTTPPESGKPIPLTEAAVTSPDGHQFSITWSMPALQSVTVFAGEDPAGIGRDKPVAKGGPLGAVSVSEPAAARWYFELVPEDGGPLVI
ncbi:MAG: hypothetical protein JO255_20800, partial [Alphaproteobacteria bacterium]|nr:hypothetical protein [Alphaproteobacteria bacterium]